jgi:hypothetical protein
VPSHFLCRCLISRSGYAKQTYDNARIVLTARCARLSSCRPVRRGCFREALLKQGGMRRPASPCMHTDAGRRPGSTALPPLRAGRANAPITSKGTAHAGKSRKNVRFEPKPMIAFKNISYAPILHPTPAVKEEAADPPRRSAERLVFVGWAVRAFTPVFDGLWARLRAVPTQTFRQS